MLIDVGGVWVGRSLGSLGPDGVLQGLTRHLAGQADEGKQPLVDLGVDRHRMLGLNIASFFVQTESLYNNARGLVREEVSTDGLAEHEVLLVRIPSAYNGAGRDFHYAADGCMELDTYAIHSVVEELNAGFLRINDVPGRGCAAAGDGGDGTYRHGEGADHERGSLQGVNRVRRSRNPAARTSIVNLG